MDRSKFIVSIVSFTVIALAVVLVPGEFSMAKSVVQLSEDVETQVGIDQLTLEPTPLPEFKDYTQAEWPTTQVNSISASTSVTVTLGAWRNLRPTESYLRDVSMLLPTFDVDCISPDQKSKGWIVGDSGTILSYCNGVWDHAIVVESVPTDLWGVQAILPTLGVAVGEQGAVLMYLWDEIAQDWVWTKSPIPVGNQTLYNVSMVSDGNGGYIGWAVGSKDFSGQGTLVRGTITPKTVDGKPTFTSTWENLTAYYPALPEVDYYYGIHMLLPNDGWATGGKIDDKGVILHWDGSQWSIFQEIGDDTITGIYMHSADKGWAVGRDGAIYKFNGTEWVIIPSPTSDVLIDINFSPDGVGWISGMNGALLKYTEDEWNIFTDLRTDPFDFRAIDFTSGHGWIVAFNDRESIGGHILEYEDGLWLAVTPPTDNRLNDVSVVSDTDAWAVGMADSSGGTIIHWDGAHWKRWYQNDLTLPSVDLYTIEMISAKEGWAAGDPSSSGEPAVFLRWDGHRWYQPRYEAPVNVRVNDLALLDKEFGVNFGGWAAASNGNAIAKWDGNSEYWSANHTCYGIYYNLRSTSIVTSTNVFNWDAWGVGTSLNPATGEYFLRYLDGCSGGYAWQTIQQPNACDPGQTDGSSQTKLRGIQMRPGSWGYSVGNYKDRASIYSYSDAEGSWSTDWCMAGNSSYRPSMLYSTDIVAESGVSWFGGYFTDPTWKRKEAYVGFLDALGFYMGLPLFPLNGVNIYHRPILSLDMASDTMGWAVGDGEDAGNLSVIYQYPYPNFTLDINPESRAILPDASTTYTVTVNSIGGFSADVSLSIPSTPEGITADLNPTTINAETVATINISTEASIPLGIYEIPLVGSATFRSGDADIPVSRTTYLRLIITNNPIYYVTPDSGPSGTVVTITGANFGADPGQGNRNTTANHVILAGVQMPDTSVTSWSNTEINIKVPDDPALFPQGPQYGQVSVTASGSTSNTDFTYHLENYLDDIELTIGGSGISVTISGTSLGDDPGALFRSTFYEHVSLNGVWIPVDDVLSWNNNTIIFTLPSDTSDGQIRVTSNGFESNALLLTTPGTGSKDVFLPLVVMD